MLLHSIKLKNLPRFLILLTCIFIIFIPFSAIEVTVSAATNDELSAKLSDLSKQLDAIKQKKQQVENQLNQESSNQNSLASQITVYDAKIESLELTIEEKTKTIESYETQIAIIESEMKDKEAKIADLQARIDKLNEIYSDRVNVNFQNSFKTTLDNLLEGNSFESYLVEKELSNSLAQENQQLADQMMNDKNELDTARAKLADDLKQQQDLQDQIKAETTDLGNQEIGLQAQKDTKAYLLQQSQKLSGDLQKQRDDLDAQKKKIEQEEQEYIAKLANLPVNGSYVAQGTPIAKMGRTGYVLECNSGGCYYPDPIKEPCAGAHTHVEIWVNTSGNSFTITNPEKYIPSIISAPFKSYTITQGYGPSPYYGGQPHTGTDFVGDAGCGTPVYAGTAGLVSYSCYHSSYVNADTYVATLYDPVHKLKILYLHIQKIGGISCS